MHPERGLIVDLDNQGGRNHNKTREKHDEHRRPIASVDKGIVKSTHLASRLQGQKPAKELAFAAARTAASRPGHERRQRRKSLLSHRGPRELSAATYTQ